MDSEFCPSQNAGGVLFFTLFIALLLSVFILVTLMLIFTCVNAYKVKSRPEAPSYPNDEELDSLDKFQLDNKYSNLPEEYVPQIRDFMQNQRRFSSISFGFLSMSSSQLFSKSDSCGLYQQFFRPVHSEDGGEMTGQHGKNISRRKSAMKHTLAGETKTSRRISWPDEENHEFMEMENTKHGKISCNRRTSGLEVILEIEI